MHTVFALLCFVVVIHWLISPYPSGLLHWHCGNLTIAPVPAKQPWWIWINTSCEFIMNDCITTTKQSTTKPCAYFLGYTVCLRCVRKFQPRRRMVSHWHMHPQETRVLVFNFREHIQVDQCQGFHSIGSILLPQVLSIHVYVCVCDKYYRQFLRKNIVNVYDNNGRIIASP